MKKYFSCEVIASVLSGYPYANSEEIMEFLASISEPFKRSGAVKEFIYLNHPQLRGHINGYDVLNNVNDRRMFLEREIKLFTPNGSAVGFGFNVSEISNIHTEEIQSKGKK